MLSLEQWKICTFAGFDFIGKNGNIVNTRIS